MKKIFFLLFPIALTAQNNDNVKIGSAKATAFIQTLNETQKKRVSFPLNEMTRYEWHYVPSTMLGRTGISVKDLDSTAKQAFYELLKTFLSNEGYAKTLDIMSLEHILKELEPNNTHRIPENYYVSIYGDPEKDATWAWKFTGHHLALNFTVIDDKLAFAPLFLGANPAEVKSGPQKGKRVLKNEEDLAFEIIHSMTPEQKAKTIFDTRAFSDIVTTNSQEVNRLKPAGILAKDMTEQQKITLNKLIMVYLSSMPTAIAETRMKRVIKEDMNAIRFGWTGSAEYGKGHYYRIQGNSFLIEFDNTQNNANHIHAVWRDFNGDYGRDLLKEHYKNAPHHQKH
jgi:hypothetical protein